MANLLKEHGQIERAKVLMDKMFHVNNRTNKTSNKISQLISKSRILSIQAKFTECTEGLEEALALVYPDNYVRSLVKEGALLGNLLRMQHHLLPVITFCIHLRGKEIFMTKVEMILDYMEKHSDEQLLLVGHYDTVYPKGVFGEFMETERNTTMRNWLKK